MTRILHLVRRTWSSLDNRALSAAEMEPVNRLLLSKEYELWVRMQPRDQRHSLLVLRQFDRLLPAANAAERRAALLHDIGKGEGNLGVFGRICATLFGPRLPSFRVYLSHEAIGLDILRDISDARTLEVLKMDAFDDAGRALRRADDL